jgi:hypothetical protein
MAQEEINHLEELEHLVDAIETGVKINDPVYLVEMRYLDNHTVSGAIAQAEQIIHGPENYGLTENQVEPYGVRMNSALRKYDSEVFHGGVV